MMLSYSGGFTEAVAELADHERAGLGIAFHAKPKLREAAHTSISAMGLDAILYLLGITGRDVLSLESE